MHTSRPSKLGCRSPQFAIRLSLLCSLTISGVRAVPAPAALAKRSMWTSPTTVTFTTATSDTAGQWTSDPPCDSMTTTAACQTTTIFYCPTDTASLTTLASSTASTSWVATSYESSSNVWASATSIAGVHTSVADISIVSLASSTDSIPIWTTTDAPTSTDCWTTVYATSCPCTTTTEDPPCDDTTTSISHTTPTQDPPCDTTTEEPTPTWTDVTLPPCDTTETPSPTAVPSGPSCAAGLVAEDFAFNEIFQNNTPTAVGTTFESSLVVNGTTTGISRGTCTDLKQDDGANYCSADYTFGNLGTFQLAGIFNPTTADVQGPLSIIGTTGHFFSASGFATFQFTFNETVQQAPIGGQYLAKLCVVAGN